MRERNDEREKARERVSERERERERERENEGGYYGDGCALLGVEEGGGKVDGDW